MANITKNQKDESRSVESYEPQTPFTLVDRFFDDNLDPFNMLAPTVLGRRLANVVSSFPKVDVAETDTEIRVTANVPGVDPNKIEVEVGDDYLTLSGRIEKEQKKNDPSGKVYRYEREFGEFRREFSLPARVNKNEIVAKIKNGVLTLTLPKSKEEHRTKVKVDAE